MITFASFQDTDEVLCIGVLENPQALFAYNLAFILTTCATRLRRCQGCKQWYFADRKNKAFCSAKCQSKAGTRRYRVELQRKQQELVKGKGSAKAHVTRSKMESTHMARKGDGIYLRGGSWRLDCKINGERHVVGLGKGIKRGVALELASVARAAILKNLAGIGKKRKDITFEEASAAYQVYRQALDQLAQSFAEKSLSQISSFDIERHKHRRVEAGARVVANREISRLGALFNMALKREMFEGTNPVVGVKRIEKPGGRLRFLAFAEEASLMKVAVEPVRSCFDSNPRAAVYTSSANRTACPTSQWTNCLPAPARTQALPVQGSPYIASAIHSPHGW